MKKRRGLAFFLGVIMILGVFSGCGDRGVNQQQGSKVILNGDEIYPVQSEDTLTYWMSLNPMLTTDYTNFAETPLGMELEKRTGVKITYMHPQAGQANEQFNIMLAGDELTDMVQYGWNGYAGGPDKAIEEGYILKLNDILKEYAPSLWAYLGDNPDIDKKVKTDGGNYYTIPFVRGEDWLTTYQGLILRKDWLDKAGKEVPTTLDELEDALTIFKDEYASGAPLMLMPAQRNYIMYAHNIGEGFYLDGGDVKYGPTQPEYKDVLTRMKKWFDTGILDNNMVSMDSKYMSSKLLNSEAGAYYGAVVGGIGINLDAKPDSVPEFDLVATPQVTLNATQKPEFGTKEDNVHLGVGIAIASKCKNVELAARFLDYGFTDEGYMLYNFGIEGVSYNMENGEPILSELLTNNPDGLSVTNVAPRYLRASYSGPFVQDERYVEQSLAHPKQQLDAYQKWSNTNMGEHILPPITLLAGEMDEDATIMANVKTYVDEMFVAFVTGREPIENFDKYIAQVENFGIGKSIQMRQSALERYNNR